MKSFHRREALRIPHASGCMEGKIFFRVNFVHPLPRVTRKVAIAVSFRRTSEAIERTMMTPTPAGSATTLAAYPLLSNSFDAFTSWRDWRNHAAAAPT